MSFRIETPRIIQLVSEIVKTFESACLPEAFDDAMLRLVMMNFRKCYEDVFSFCIVIIWDDIVKIFEF